MKPKYPIYIISKGRAGACLTANFMIEDGAEFYLVVEPQEAELYSHTYGSARLLVLPFSNLGKGSIPARNWVWEHSKENGHKRHWIFDDNIRLIRRLYKGKRLRCATNLACSTLEEFVDRYENIGIAGMNYTMFVTDHTPKPFYLNVHVYSCLLIDNSLEYRWRGRYNEDTDLCLQVLSSGSLCTVSFNAFTIDKVATGVMSGGNADELYKGDGRLKMARALERNWPGVVTTDRRFKRPQHVIKNSWKGFDTKLVRRTDLDWDKIANKVHKIKLTAVKDVQSETLRKVKQDYEGN